jgi:hypothetical protein
MKHIGNFPLLIRPIIKSLQGPFITQRLKVIPIISLLMREIDKVSSKVTLVDGDWRVKWSSQVPPLRWSAPPPLYSPLQQFVQSATLNQIPHTRSTSTYYSIPRQAPPPTSHPTLAPPCRALVRSCFTGSPYIHEIWRSL